MRVWKMLHRCLLTMFFAGTFAWTAHPQEDLETKTISSTVSVRGTVTVVQADDFVHSTTKKHHWLQESGGQGRRFKLTFAKGAPSHCCTGSVGTATGTVSGSEFLVAAWGEEGTPLTGAAADAVFGDVPVGVILVNFLNASVPTTPSAVNTLVFTGSSSIDALFTEASFAQMTLSGNVHGPYLIQHSTTSQNYIAWADAADAAATAAGVNLNTYTKIVYVMPSAGLQDVNGLGSIGGRRAWVFESTAPPIYAHELGHTLGLFHARTPTAAYGDDSCIMGSPWFIVHPHALHKLDLGWIPATGVQTLVASGSYTVAQCEVQTTETRILQIPIPGTEESYFLSYRRPIGFDVSLSSLYKDRTSVHRWRNSMGGDTTLHAALADGQVFEDSVMRVVQLSHDAARSVVSVTIKAGSLARIVVTPSSVTLLDGQTQQFTAQGYDAAGNPISAPFGWGATGGTVTSTGLYTAPGTAGTYTVTASYGPVSGSASAKVNAVTSIAVTPYSVSIPIGGSQTFTATVRDQLGNIVSAPVTWSATGGAISTTGQYVAPQTPGIYTVRATRGTVSGAATVTVQGPAVRIAVVPGQVFVAPGYHRNFSAVGYDSANNLVTVSGVSWSCTAGSISSTGRYTAPGTTGLFSVQARSGSMTGTASVRVPSTVIRGDVNGDAVIDIVDVNTLINYTFRGGTPPAYLEQGDTDANNVIDIVDVNVLINYAFRGGPQPPTYTGPGTPIEQ